MVRGNEEGSHKREVLSDIIPKYRQNELLKSMMHQFSILPSQGSVPVAEPNSDLQPLVGHPKRLLSLDQMLSFNDK